VCVHVHVYGCMPVHGIMCVYVHVHVCGCMPVHGIMCVYVHVHVCGCMPVHGIMCAGVQVCVHMYECECIYTHVCACVSSSVHVCMHEKAVNTHTWMPEDNFQESAFSFHHVSPRDGTQAVRLTDRHHVASLRGISRD
jgi:hypothetical protein